MSIPVCPTTLPWWALRWFPASCICIFEFFEVYLKGKFLEGGLLGHKVMFFHVSLREALNQLTFLPALFCCPTWERWHLVSPTLHPSNSDCVWPSFTSEDCFISSDELFGPVFPPFLFLGGQASDGAAGVGLRPVTHLCISGWGGGDGGHSREE